MRKSHKKQYTDLNGQEMTSRMPESDMDELYARIEASAEEVNVPESLEPEAVKMRLRASKHKFPVRRTVEIAAAVALIVTVSGTGIYGMITRNANNAVDTSAPDNAGNNAKGSDSGMETDGAQPQEAAECIQEQIPAAKTKKVGNYHLASSYDEVSQMLESQQKKYMESSVYNGVDTGAEDLKEGGQFRNEQKDSDSVVFEAEAVEESAVASDDNTGINTDYSTTNLQVEGVDESDFIKNDGNYLYVQTEDQISVIDIREKQMKELAVITPQMNASDYICDMYVDGEQLYLILQRRESTLDESEDKAERALVDLAVDYYYMETNTVMELQTYDISDRANAKYLGAVTQDGGYYSSRKVGDYIYLFSRKNAYDAQIPEINGARALYDCIYMQEQAESELIIASVNTKEPEKVVDHMVLMNNYAQIYMGTDAIYLYSDNYEWNEVAGDSRSYTDIAKFSYDDGILNGVAAASVQGTIQDAFAISENSGILRVLTTEWKNVSTNQLYLLDEKLKLLGQLKDIAAGEEIYAARYIGNTAYFITYHNTDPLFAVDISNPSEPKMLGQVEITGFSDYLHPYGDGLLLGIGYETDPDTSERLGVKLVMFDISNPGELKILDSVVLDGDSCNAAHDYKCALVSTVRNLIGFSTADWRDDRAMRYLLYSWDGGKFVKQFSDTVDDKNCWDDSKIRGLYAGEQFYLVSPADSNGYRIRSYDMTADYKELDKLVVK